MNDVVSVPTHLLEITLCVSDPEVIHELERRGDGDARDGFAAQALRLGVLALRQANGSLDADTIRREGQHLLAQMDTALQARTAELSKESDALLTTLSATLKKALDGQRDEVLKQFSLDRKDSALSRLLAGITTSNGKLRGELAEDVAKLVEEFSLDNEDGALSRLSSLLQQTNEAVETSLTLDDEASPLARLRREILDVLAHHKDANVHFQTEVRSTLETFKTRREEAARSTQHGVAFEDQVGEQLELEAKRVGDICEHVGLVNGRLQRKLGDYVVELGLENASAGARIVFEAKAKKNYTVKNALKELGEARKNRDAQVGVFVFDRASAPKGLDSLDRAGSDILVVWDADDVSTDIYLRTAFALARTLAHRTCVADSMADADFSAIDELIGHIAAHVATLEAIEKAAQCVTKNGKTILSSAQSMRDALEHEVEKLRGHVVAVRGPDGSEG